MPRANRAKIAAFIGSAVGKVVGEEELLLAVKGTGDVKCFPANKFSEVVVAVVDMIGDSVSHILETLGDDELEVRGFHSSIESTSEVRSWILEAVDSLEYSVFSVGKGDEAAVVEYLVGGFLYIIEFAAFQYTASGASVDAGTDLVT